MQSEPQKLCRQIAEQFRTLYFGPNWTAVDLQTVLADVSLEQATRQIESFHTIVALVYHMNYYVRAVTKVLQGGPLDAHDDLSFDHPPVTSEADWQNLKDATWSDAEEFARLVAEFPAEKLWEDFCDPKYGNAYRNFTGIIEHSHYHLGQIVMLKKMLH